MSDNERFTAKDVAYVSIMTALLIGGQAVLGFVSGVEVVTVLLACFSYSFGAKRGMLAATAFSLLRNFIWGFYPSVIVLYLVYYNAFAFITASLAKLKSSIGQTVAFTCVFLFMVCACVYFCVCPLKISPYYKNTLKVFFIVILSLFSLAFLAFFVLPLFFKSGGERIKKLVFVTAICCMCTVGFTLLDDVITPLFYGYSLEAAHAYFITSFTAMLPQTVCTFVSVSALFYPLTKIFTMFSKSFVKKA